MLVEDVLKRKGRTVFTVHGYVLVSGAVDIMHSKKIGALPVLDPNEQLIGIISERDVVVALAQHGPGVLSMRVADVMTPHVFTCTPEHHLSDIMARMTHHRIRHLPVLDGDKLDGLISIGDVVKHRLQEVETEANVLRDLYIAGS